MSDPKIVPISATHPESGDEFDDLDNTLRVSQDYETRGGSRRVQLNIPVGRPPKQAYIRVKPGWQFTVALVELKQERELYLITRDMIDALALDTVAATLRLAVDREGNLRLWPLRLPGADGRDNPYWQTGRLAAELAEREWVRVVANQATGGYDAHSAINQQAYGEPQWPELSMNEILRVAFKQALINSDDHPIVRKLRGES